MKNTMLHLFYVFVLSWSLYFILGYFEALLRDSERMSQSFHGSMTLIGLVMIVLWTLGAAAWLVSVKNLVSEYANTPATAPPLPQWIKGLLGISAIGAACSIAYWVAVSEYIVSSSGSSEGNFLFMFGVAITVLSVSALLAGISLVMRQRD